MHCRLALEQNGLGIGHAEAGCGLTAGVLRQADHDVIMREVVSARIVLSESITAWCCCSSFEDSQGSPGRNDCAAAGLNLFGGAAMKLHAIALAVMISLGPSLVLAQGSGGGGGTGSGSAAGSPSAGSAGAGTLGTSGVPPGPANSAGLNNTGNDPSGSGNTPRFNPGSTTGIARPAPGTPSSGDTRNPTSPRGTNTLGTAKGSGVGGGGSLRSNGTRMPGAGEPTVTSQQDSDNLINAENRKLNHALNSICRGC